jgi:hypothetical protein
VIKVVIDLLLAEESLARNVFDRKSSDHIESPPSLFVGENVNMVF